MIAAYIVGTVAEVLLLGPSVLAVFGSSSTSTWAYVGIGCAVGLIMLVIAVIGIQIMARVQVSMAVVEYLILIGLAIAGLVWVLGHHVGSVPVTRGWFSCPASTARATRWPGSWSRCSSTAAGTAPCTSTRRSGTAG
jgi:amino acid transporter